MLDVGFSKSKIASVFFLIFALMIPLLISSLVFETNIEGNCNQKSEGLTNNEITKMKQHMKEMNKHMKQAPETVKK